MATESPKPQNPAHDRTAAATAPEIRLDEREFRMSRLQILDNTNNKEAMAARNEWINSIGHICTPRNSRFYSLSFRPGTSEDEMTALVEMSTLVERFRDKLVDKAGIHPCRLFFTYVLMTKPHHHAHCIGISDKDRRTGRSITNMPKATINGLFEWWQDVAGNSAESVAVWGPAGLADYLAGFHNVRRPGQRWARGDVHNPLFLKRLERRQERRCAK
ncbi:MAG: hypothetical protein IH612_02120 [Desulfofustis sp.]|nr:hypothetical protein [Desulfofustis sp.]